MDRKVHDIVRKRGRKEENMTGFSINWLTATATWVQNQIHH